ncbi:MAG: aminoglycoside phosphotransferase family protein [Betaproteobacteria bacterium]|nr:aminoglycoside phosphotransferase family protein [Betaproteobacteria bacterium]
METNGTPSPAPGREDDQLARALVRMAIVSADQRVRLSPLAGGVSSDIYRADLPSGVVCVKRALPRLKVAADWRVPVERNRWEVEWMRVAGAVVPSAVPEILGEDREAGAFAMAWLPPDLYPVWKALLAQGEGTVGMAARVGDTLGRIHAATADRPDVAARFATDALFHAIRLDPYLVTAAAAHPDLADRLHALVATTAGTRRTLVHGDFSPKNILIGPEGPVILDAECAWYGDPAFDVAFVLNHLLLKGVWRPQWRAQYAEMYRALVAAYRPHVAWEGWATLDARTAALLPGLLLARVDGKSPAEYVTADADRDAIRRFAHEFVARPPATLERLVRAWSP